MCAALQETLHVFASVNTISHRYHNSEMYVVKRLWSFTKDQGNFCGQGAP